MNPNLKAFLDVIAWAEGTSTHPLTKCDGYDVIVNGVDADGKVTREVFTDFSAHPFANRAPKVVNRNGLTSTAAGRYQFLARYWPAYKLQLSLPDFGQDSQDRWAAQLVKECRALDDVTTGHFTVAVGKCASRWASLPGANYPGQPMRQIAQLEDQFEQFGGRFA